MSHNDYGRFKCRACGSRFDLDDHEDELYSEGYYMTDPEFCLDCDALYNLFDPEPYNFSDADPGL